MDIVRKRSKFLTATPTNSNLIGQHHLDMGDEGFLDEIQGFSAYFGDMRDIELDGTKALHNVYGKLNKRILKDSQLRSFFNLED